MEPRATIDHSNGESIILIDGRPAGLPVADTEAAIVCRWLNSALLDVEFRTKTTDPVVEENVMLADLVDVALTSRLTGLRFVLADALNALGPVWHTFRSPVRFRGTEFRPGDSGLLVAVGRKVEAFQTGFIPSWVKRTGPDWDQSARVVLPAKLRERFRIRSTQNARPARLPVACSGSAVRPPWE